MKKWFLILLFPVFSLFFSGGVFSAQDVGQKDTIAEKKTTMIDEDKEFLDALQRMHEAGMTRYDTVGAFRPYDYVSRQEASKFFGGFSVHVLYKVIDQKRYCIFDDIDTADVSLRNSIVESCLLHIFNGAGGNFFPKRVLTKAEALTVLIRSLEGEQDESGVYRRAMYLERARALGLTKEFVVADLERPVTRYEVALLLWRANKAVQ